MKKDDLVKRLKTGDRDVLKKVFDYFDYRENLIVDENNPILVQKAWRERFSKDEHWDSCYGGQAYLSRKNSEDALVWNVFRTLQTLGNEGLSIINGVFRLSGEVKKLLFWGCDLDTPGDEQQMLSILLRVVDGQSLGTMTEPDMVIITSKEVAFVECKLNQSGKSSPWKVQSISKGVEKRLEVYKELEPKIGDIQEWKNVYQLIRQYIYSILMGKMLDRTPFVISLIKEEDKEVLNNYYKKLNEYFGEVFKEFVTWQHVNEEIKKSNLADKDKNKIIKVIDSALNAAKKVKQKNLTSDEAEK